MFGFAALLLAVALLLFGGVQAHVYTAAAVIWIAASALLILWRILKRGALDPILAIIFLGGILSISVLGWKLAIWVISGLWAWQASREYPMKIVPYLKMLVLIGILEACLGFAQHLVAPGWVPGLGYQNIQGGLVSGTLINRNHFAGLMEMLIPCCIGLGFIAARRYRSISGCYLYILAATFIGMALALSLSRAGIFSFVVSVLLIVIVFVRKAQRMAGIGLGFGLLGMFLAGILWVGIDAIVGRYGELLRPQAAVDNARLTIYWNTIQMIRRFPLGVGIGGYVDGLRPFQTTHLGLLFDHAHNDYLETIAEWGVAAAIPFWLGIIALFLRLLRGLMLTESAEEQGILLACTGGMFTILVHSIADFNLQIPSNAILFFSFAGISMGMLYPGKHQSENLQQEPV